MEHQENIAKLTTHPDYCVTLLSELHKAEAHTDVNICSDGRTVPVHSAILCQCSEFMSDLLPLSETNLIILPGFSTILSDFVTLLYTGQAPSLNKQEMISLTSLCEELGLDTRSLKQDDNGNKIAKKVLKVKTDVLNESSQERFSIRLPISRIDQKITTNSIKDNHRVFDGFKGKIQREYNRSPVGPYEGNFDQHPQVPLFAQLPKSKLSFDQYTNFVHPQEFQCKIFKIKQNYKNINDLDKIEALEVTGDSTELFDNKSDDEKVFYTCNKKSCRIPCLCHICSLDDESQCLDHNMKHEDLFDENNHLFSVRSTDIDCSNENFFLWSYILRYPGIPETCKKCERDLFHHKSYHLVFHWNCKFCKLYQYKIYPKSIKDLEKREVQEKAWYKKVCPYCDKKFVEPFQTRKHIEFEHNRKFEVKCDECQKPFQCKQSLVYHKLKQHTVDSQPPLSCHICHQKFFAKVTLNNHIKFKHSDLRKFDCQKCDAKFKQRKNLNAHLINVHGTNPRKEDYWQDLQKETFKCKSCGKEFARKTDLKVHIKVKHTTQELFPCDKCEKQYSYKTNLERHKLEKHGLELKKYKCPECGAVLTQRSNMKRHQLSHEDK